jgi:hypothetical protein
MEEDLTPEEPEKEYEEFDIDTNNPIFVFCFMFMEYIKEINPELYKKAHKYAEDHTDIDIADFEIVMNDDEDEDEDESEQEDDIDYEDDDYSPEN